jgi:hypothetical protein
MEKGLSFSDPSRFEAPVITREVGQVEGAEYPEGRVGV